MSVTAKLFTKLITEDKIDCKKMNGDVFDVRSLNRKINVT